MDIAEYINLVKKTDQLGEKDELTPALFGLYGEVGGLLSITKKSDWRESRYKDVFVDDVKDEIGDICWYLYCLAMRLNIDPMNISFHNVGKKLSSKNEVLMNLGKIAGEMLDESYLKKDKVKKIESFVEILSEAITVLSIDWESAINANMKKIESRFLPYDKTKLRDFDEKFPEYEKIPRKFEIEFLKKKDGTQAIRWNKVFIGDPLKDNSFDNDGYRFHDVFHLSYAAILHWSPVFRSLIKHKRKSNPEIDEVQDGGRAKVVEEGISAWVFNVAKENNFFEDCDGLTFDLLKHIEQAVKGLEVVQCPLSLWEKAILEGYKVFRELKENGEGMVMGDREKRTISYKN